MDWLNEEIHIAENIKRLRREKKMTQQELADKINVQRTSISKYEKGVTTPSLSQLKKIADVFNVDVNELFGNENIHVKIGYTPEEEEEEKRLSFIKDLSRHLNSEGQHQVIKYIVELYENPKYKK